MSKILRKHIKTIKIISDIAFFSLCPVRASRARLPDLRCQPARASRARPAPRRTPYLLSYITTWYFICRFVIVYLRAFGPCVPPDGSHLASGGHATSHRACVTALPDLRCPTMLAGCQKKIGGIAATMSLAALSQSWLARHCRKHVSRGIAATMPLAALPQSWIARHCRKSFMPSGTAANRLCTAALPQTHSCVWRHCRK